MPQFAPEPPFSHEQPQRVGLLLCNLGTPDEPTAPALRRYLAEFLSDPRVVEIPKPLWWLILHGVILRVRPAKSAAKYASIWMPEGSPLKVWTQRLALRLQGNLGEAGHHVLVRYAMRYGNPSMASELDALKAAGATRILIVPAYPQYCAATTASIVDAVNAWSVRQRRLPELRHINHYHDDPGYIEALAQQVRRHWLGAGRAPVLVMSFHGVPARTLRLGDPYHCHCHKTARLLATALGLQPSQYRVTFQSRFGRAKWLEPYTEPTLVALAQQGVAEVDVICPGFVADCLETLEEIAQEAKEAFAHAGGKQLRYIACLNDQTLWVQALTALCTTHLQGWPTQADPQASAAIQARATQRQAALTMGAAI
jgi:protoporphyrin/coproporphyrin ferrochelatase